MKRKVLFITPSLRQGGVEHSLITCLSLLDPNQYEITLFLYTEMLDLLPEVPEHVNVIVGVDKTKYYRRPYVISLLLKQRICKLIKRDDAVLDIQTRINNYIHRKKVEHPQRVFFSKEYYDAIVSYSLHIGTEMALMIQGNKRFVFMHSSDPDYHKEIIEKDLIHYDKIVAVSSSIAKVYQENYPYLHKKIISIENYVDAERIIKQSKESCISTLKRDCITIATCGRISHEKGFNLAVEAADYLKKQGVKFYWLFIGDGADRDKIEKDLKEKKLEQYIEITGYKENPYPHMAVADVYVQPSYEEAQPLVLLEAMVLGKPIVSTKTVGGNTILKGGEKGVLTDFSGQDIAKGILSLINNPDKRHSFENLYTLEDNEKEKQVYIEKMNQLLLH